MAKERIEVATAEGTLDGVLFVPEGAGPWPLVAFFVDAGGLRPAMSEMAERLVAAGYAVVQPNLYWRSGPFAPFDAKTMFQDEAERKRVMALLSSVKSDQAVADAKAIVEAASKDARVASQRIGCVGYCMGGRVAFVVATALGERVAAAAAIHAGGLVSDAPDSPHLGASKIRGALYVGVADDDRSCTPEHQATLGKALKDAGVDHVLELYRGARHGFAVPDFPVYDAAAAERHWECVLTLFARTLGSR